MVADLTREELLVLVHSQAQVIKELREEIAQLLKRIEGLERQQRKYVAPHSRDQRKADPQKAGRKAGQGSFKFREQPNSADVTEHIDVPVPNTCAACGFEGELIRLKTDLAWVTELPEQKRFQIKEYRVPVMLCPKCKKPVRGQHADLGHDQCGATAHRLGKNLVATLLAVRYELGIPERKLPRLAEILLGLSLTQSAVNQMVARIAASGGALQEHLKMLTLELRLSAYLHHDDTGWRMGGTQAWVSGFRSESVALFTINKQHTRHEILNTLGKDFAGVLIADRFKVYDSHDLEHLQHQKCLAHILRNISDVIASHQGKRGRGELYGKSLQILFRESLEIHKAFLTGTLTTEELSQKSEEKNAQLFALLDRSELKSKGNERLRKGLLKQHQEGRLLHFLKDPKIPPTNNAAERQLRSVVIARKVSQCSKNEVGAMNYASIKSVVETARLRGHDPVKILANLYR